MYRCLLPLCKETLKEKRPAIYTDADIEDTELKELKRHINQSTKILNKMGTPNWPKIENF